VKAPGFAIAFRRAAARGPEAVNNRFEAIFPARFAPVRHASSARRADFRSAIGAERPIDPRLKINARGPFLARPHSGCSARRSTPTFDESVRPMVWGESVDVYLPAEVSSARRHFRRLVGLFLLVFLDPFLVFDIGEIFADCA